MGPARTHPGWASVAERRTPDGFNLIDHDAPTQAALIARAQDLLIEAGAPPPTAFRAGSYAANAATLAALAALGIRYDASHNGSHLDVSHLPLPARQTPRRDRDGRRRFTGENIQAAADTVLAEVKDLGGTGGTIVAGPDGSIAWSMTTAGMYRGRATAMGEHRVAIYADEG